MFNGTKAGKTILTIYKEANMSEIKPSVTTLESEAEVQQTQVFNSAPTGFKILNKFISLTLLCYLASHFLPFFVVSLFGETSSSSAADMMSGGQMVFMLFYITLGVLSATTGVFPLASKIVVCLILIVDGMGLYDVVSEASEASDMMRMMGIDLTSPEGLQQALQFLGIGAYLYAASLIMMVIALCKSLEKRNRPAFSDEELQDSEKLKEKAKAWSKQTGNQFEAYIELMNIQFAQIKAALNEHDANSAVNGFSSGIEQVKKAAEKKDASSGADGVYGALKNGVSYVFGYTRTVWNANNTGKALVVVSVIIILDILL